MPFDAPYKSMPTSCPNRESVVSYPSRCESLVEGAKYDQVYKTYVLALVDFIMFKEREKYYTHFELLATDDITLRLSPCLQFVFIEMGKFMRAYKSCDLAGFIDHLDNRGLWVYIIKMTPYLTAEHRKLIAARDAVMEEAVGIIEQLDRIKGPERILAEAKEKAKRDQWARAEYKFDQGIAKGEQLGVIKGRQEGRQEEQINMARRMLRAGEPISKICEFTGLLETDVRKLMLSTAEYIKAPPKYNLRHSLKTVQITGRVIMFFI